MGSRSNQFAYIAGFLDGDGSLMLQIKKRSDSKAGWRFMATICFYQDSRKAKPLFWIRKILGIGYISKRNDGITELRVNGYKQINSVLEKLLPYVLFKKKQAEALLIATSILQVVKSGQLNNDQLNLIVDQLLIIQGNNYATRTKKSREDIMRILGLTP